MVRQPELMVSHHGQLLEVLKCYFGDKKINGFEIGTNAGDSARMMVKNLPNLEMLYTCDPWKNFPGEQFEAGHPQDYHEAQKKAAEGKLEEFKDRVAIMQMTSDEAYSALMSMDYRGVDIDFIWIDGHHTKEQVLKDIENGLTLLGGKEGRLIGGHDYGLVYGVKEVVNGIFKDKVNTGGDFTWWIYL